MTRGRQSRSSRVQPRQTPEAVVEGERADDDDDYSVDRPLSDMSGKEKREHAERVRQRSLTVYDWIQEKNKVHLANQKAIRERRYNDIQELPQKPF